MNPKDEIFKLKHGEKWTWPESDYGHAEIWRIHDVYIVFSIPMFGGDSTYFDAFSISNVDELIYTVSSWT